MRLRARWGIAPLLAAPAGAWALGLGQLEVQSALNQPFRAEIELSATTDELQGLKVGLADADMFARQGLDRPAFLSRLEFRVVTGRDGRSVIQITSRESIAEPFVTLLVQATWPRGRNVKEYTVLLDPPVLLPAPATSPAIQPAETRPSSSTSGGTISRPVAPPAETPRPSAPPPAPAQQVTPAVSEPPPANISSTAPPPPRQPVSAAGGTYGPVQRGETLWALSDRMRPEGISINQMMIAIFRDNPQAFSGNINILRAGATLHLPESVDFDGLARTVANAEVVRQTDEWQNRTAQGGQLRLLAPSDTQTARTPTPSPAPIERVTPAPPPRPVETPAPAAGVARDGAAADAGDRLVAVNNSDLRNLQNTAAAGGAGDVTAPNADVADPGVNVEEQLFADEQQPPPAPAETETPVAVPTPAPAPVSTGPSLVSQAIGWLASPLLWIGLGVAALLLTALWFVRRRRQEPEDVTGRWEALESETDEDQESREATARLRRQAPEDTIVVEEQHAERARPAPAVEPDQTSVRRTPAPRPQKAVSPDETLSSQTVINLDQADAVAEADFHIAYGLYDQAAELVQKALEAAPDRRDLKLKLLEVYFMWGNKDAFLKAANSLRADVGESDDPDWNKVVIMGKQICPDERLFTEAKTGGARVDVDLEAGDSPLDLAFDDAASADIAVASSGLDLDLEASDQRPAPKAAAKPATKSAGKPAARGSVDDGLDIGARTAAGLEAALFTDEDLAGQTTPDLSDSLAVTQESPTIERPGSGNWSTSDGATAELTHDSPTVETPTIEGLGPKTSSTIKSKTVAMPRRTDPTVEQPGLGTTTGEFTAEIDLDDLGLDVKDIEGLPGDLGDLPMAGGQSDTREQPALSGDDGLLSATGVTKVLHAADDDDGDTTESKTSVLEDQDATLLASTLTGTEVLEGRRARGDNSGNTSLVKQIGGVKDDDAVDLDLADLTAALHGADTVEQPRSFSRDVFGSGATPLDLDVGNGAAADDDPTGTEEQALDPQTMTEVGTKLDLARAYIDMGDPEGARSILQEVLDEGDSNQKREAQGLIDALHA
jgi:pilus assembly protein FimV